MKSRVKLNTSPFRKFFISTFIRLMVTKLSRVLTSKRRFSIKTLKSSPSSCWMYDTVDFYTTSTAKVFISQSNIYVHSIFETGWELKDSCSSKNPLVNISFANFFECNCKDALPPVVIQLFFVDFLNLDFSAVVFMNNN